MSAIYDLEHKTTYRYRKPVTKADQSHSDVRSFEAFKHLHVNAVQQYKWE